MTAQVRKQRFRTLGRSSELLNAVIGAWQNYCKLFSKLQIQFNFLLNTLCNTLSLFVVNICDRDCLKLRNDDI